MHVCTELDLTSFLHSFHHEGIFCGDTGSGDLGVVVTVELDTSVWGAEGEGRH